MIMRRDVHEWAKENAFIFDRSGASRAAVKP